MLKTSTPILLLLSLKPGEDHCDRLHPLAGNRLHVMSQESNGKTTAGLVVQIATIVVSIVAAVSTPIILMYSKVNAMEVEMTKKFEEVETQFRALDQTRNIQFSDQQRTNALIWNATELGKHTPYPSGPFFQPNISK